jgi:hypothetical protein
MRRIVFLKALYMADDETCRIRSEGPVTAVKPTFE